MKLNKLSLGIIAACGLMSSSAFALTATTGAGGNYTNASEYVGDTLNIRMSGATAQDVGILAATLRFCTAGSMTAYTISNNFVYFCTINSSTLTGVTARPNADGSGSGTETPTKLALYKFSVGGSANGVAPLNGTAGAANQLAFLDLSKLATSCVAGATNVTSATADADGTATNLSTYEIYTCGAASSNLTTNAASYIGVSDVEPAFFGLPSTYNRVTSSSLATVIFGVPVSLWAYEKLQLAQGIVTDGDLSADTNCGAAANRFTENCMPSLSQGQITSIFTQEGQNWNTLTGSSVFSTADKIYVARRPDTSGTQKTFEALIARTLNGTSGARNCQSSVDAFVSTAVAAFTVDADSPTYCNGSTNYVVSGSGSSQVQACLNTHNDGGRGAVGVQTTETKITDASKFGFVKINGFAPTQANVAKGVYTAYSDAALNVRGSGTGPTAGQNGYTNFVSKFKSAFATPSTIQVINGANQPFGASGLMALDAIQSPIPTADYTGASSRNPWSRLVGSATLNNCQPGKKAQ